MSHISTYSTDLQLNPVKGERAAKNDTSWQLFREALESVAEEHGGYVDEKISNYFGHERECTFALRVPQFQYGLGIDVDENTGRVSFLYDSYGVRDEIIETLKDDVKQTFTTLAVSQALNDLNYSVEFEEQVDDETERKRILVRGVM